MRDRLFLRDSAPARAAGSAPDGERLRDCWRVAVLDSGIADQAAALEPLQMLVASSRFTDVGGEIERSPVLTDERGHGTHVCRVICSTSRALELIIGQVLDHRGVTTPAALAAAIWWVLAEGADLIHMSLGLHADRTILADAVHGAVQAGCIVVASAPARGHCTFPARYPHVIRATGDARCGRDEISALNSGQADFGGCPRYLPERGLTDSDSARCAGASIGAAHVTRFLVERIARGSELATIRSELCTLARHRGPEMKSA